LGDIGDALGFGSGTSQSDLDNFEGAFVKLFDRMNGHPGDDARPIDVIEGESQPIDNKG